MEYAHLISSLLIYFPGVVFLILLLMQHKTYELTDISPYLGLFAVIFMAVCFALYPPLPGNDKYNYFVDYIRSGTHISTWANKDPLWAYMTQTLNAILRKANTFVYFLVISLLYCYSYYVYAKTHYAKNVITYFVIFAFGCICFTGYGDNTIRGGIGLACILLGMSTESRIKTAVLFIFAIFIHRSTLIPITAYLVANKFNKTKLYLIIWGICLVLSAAHVDVSSFFDMFTSVDKRVAEYALSSASGEAAKIYNPRFRPDFVLYSFVPIFIMYRWIKKYALDNTDSLRLFNTYLLVNSLWLLVIRIPYTDRFAYLSWFLIPMMLCDPILNEKIELNNYKNTLFLIMFMFVGVNIMLSFR